MTRNRRRRRRTPAENQYDATVVVALSMVAVFALAFMGSCLYFAVNGSMVAALALLGVMILGYTVGIMVAIAWMLTRDNDQLVRYLENARADALPTRMPDQRDPFFDADGATIDI